jgi:hypothetical protein
VDSNVDSLIPPFYPPDVPGAWGTPFLLTITTAAQSAKFGATASTYTFSRTTAGVPRKFAATASVYTLTTITTGARSTFGSNVDSLIPPFYPPDAPGAWATPFVLTITTAGVVSAFISGVTSSTYTLSRTTAGTRSTSGTTASTYTLGASTNAVNGLAGATATHLVLGATTAGTRTGSSSTSSTFTWTATTTGDRTTWGDTVTPIALTTSTAGINFPSQFLTGETASVYTLHIATSEKTISKAKPRGTRNQGTKGRIAQPRTGRIQRSLS